MDAMNATKLKSRHFLLVVLSLQFMFYATTFFDVPVARQVVGFLFVTFVPGFIIIKLLKLNELEALETVLLSVGLSVAFLMLAGLLVNELCSLFGIVKPLSLTPLMIILNNFILVGGILVYLRSENVKLWDAGGFGLSPLVLVFIGLPILSIAGALIVNTSGDSMILLFMILSIAVLFALAILSKKLVPLKLYPLIIFMVTIALLFHSSLVSNYIHGFDIHSEYYMFKLTQINGYWDSNAYFPNIEYGRYNSMLSVVMLPVIYSNVLNMEGTWVLKIVFPLIFSLVPLALYQMWQKTTEKKIAFISVFLLMAEMTFYTEMIGLARQMVAELFFALLFLVVLNKKMNSTGGKICFVIFSFALVVSHYGIAIIFFFLISAAWLCMQLFRKKSKTLTLSLILLFFVIMFSWYICTSSSAPFEAMMQFEDRVYNSLSDFFNPASRGTEVLRGLGMESPPSYLNMISRIFAYATEFFILIGFTTLMIKRKSGFLAQDYVVFSSISVVLLAMCILLPSFAGTMGMTRFYHIILFFLAPFFFVGCETFAGFLSKQKTKFYTSILVLIVLVPYFLFQTNFVYEVTGSESWSPPLSGYRMGPRPYFEMGYVNEKDVFGATWLPENLDIKHTRIYADFSGRIALYSYGMISREEIGKLTDTTVLSPHEVVFLSTADVTYGMVTLTLSNTTVFSILNCSNMIYSNGGCCVYKYEVED